MAKATKEEPKRKLPVGHPRAGYVAPDLSYQEDTGTLPDVEQQWHDERDEARDKEVEKIAAEEDKAAKEEEEERQKLADEMARATKESLVTKATGEPPKKSGS
jgi:hypothetical protein